MVVFSIILKEETSITCSCILIFCMACPQWVGFVQFFPCGKLRQLLVVDNIFSQKKKKNQSFQNTNLLFCPSFHPQLKILNDFPLCSERQIKLNMANKAVWSGCSIFTSHFTTHFLPPSALQPRCFFKLSLLAALTHSLHIPKMVCLRPAHLCPWPGLPDKVKSL